MSRSRTKRAAGRRWSSERSLFTAITITCAFRWASVAPGIGLRLAERLGKIPSAVLIQVNGRGAGVRLAREALDRRVRTRTFSNDPRRIAWRVRRANHVSTWFIHEAEVGVKWKVKRLWRLSRPNLSTKVRRQAHRITESAPPWLAV